MSTASSTHGSPVRTGRRRKPGGSLRIGLVVFGGPDLAEPFAGLAGELARAGHSVRAGGFEHHAERLAGVGAEFRVLGPRLAAGALADRASGALRVGGVGSWSDRAPELVPLIHAQRRYADARALAAGCDLIVCHHLDVVGQEAAVAEGVAWASVVLCPGRVEDAFHPPLHLPDLGRRGNALAWRLARRRLRASDARLAARLRALGGGGWRAVSVLTGGHSRELNFVAASPALARVPWDLPTTFRVTGSWFAADDDKLSPELSRFLEDGEPPVVLAPGPVASGTEVRVTRLLLDAVERIGVRSVIQLGNGAPLRTRGGADVLLLGPAPLDPLFARARCVVHTGGAAVTAAACRAGVPSLVLPRSADQRYWARVLVGHGVAPRPLGAWRLRSATLARRLRGVLGSHPMAERAAALGRRLRGEDGAAAARSAIEDWAASR